MNDMAFGTQSYILCKSIVYSDFTKLLISVTLCVVEALHDCD